MSKRVRKINVIQVCTICREVLVLVEERREFLSWEALLSGRDDEHVDVNAME